VLRCPAPSAFSPRAKTGLRRGCNPPTENATLFRRCSRTSVFLCLPPKAGCRVGCPSIAGSSETPSTPPICSRKTNGVRRRKCFVLHHVISSTRTCFRFRNGAPAHRAAKKAGHPEAGATLVTAFGPSPRRRAPTSLLGPSSRPPRTTIRSPEAFFDVPILRSCAYGGTDCWRNNADWCGGVLDESRLLASARQAGLAARSRAPPRRVDRSLASAPPRPPV